MRAQCGFSIIELMAVILIGSILVMLAIPSYTVFVKNNCLTTYANKLVSSFALARIEAVKQHNTVTIQAKGGDWNSGWDIKNSAGTVLRTEDLSCSTTTITETAGPYTQLNYASTGFIDFAANFNICDDRPGVNGRQVVVSGTGRPHTNTSYMCP
ncbi:MAG TPA: GspH/FimT family pseudopilin [Gammaproteobacteria bacterium]|nr:GspH/FimT family pseudopilin [Gammaproteobacteria bacterium]